MTEEDHIEEDAEQTNLELEHKVANAATHSTAGFESRGKHTGPRQVKL